ncbi:hypothetical protein [Pseudooceanicola sp.]|uniref:hypothetical protein n=1 Tax=Pseudooceanicola sp. TaxID=1914328 RepID=UPI002602EED3|nr:hypothetical protein [Pseudooceanicola sp.]MDF1856034.1 hypothetical protein [Pseudooceanicola sp.]
MQANHSTLAEASSPKPAHMAWPLAAIGLALSLSASPIVAYWIIRARIEWIALFPEESLRKPPTISRAISEPSIGDPFSLWIALVAVELFVLGIIVAMLYTRSVHATPAADVADRRRLQIWSNFYIVLQPPIALGLILLSVFRIGHANSIHMIGSYMLFISAALAQIVGLMTNLAVLTLIRHDQSMRQRGLIEPTAARLRIVACVAAIIATLTYLALFILKDTSYHTPSLYQAYVLTEVVVLILVLNLALLHAVDFARIILRHLHGRSAPATQTP